MKNNNQVEKLFERDYFCEKCGSDNYVSLYSFFHEVENCPSIEKVVILCDLCVNDMKN